MIGRPPFLLLSLYITQPFFCFLRKWRKEEENIISAMRGAFGVYVAMFPIVKRPNDSHPSILEVEQDSEMEIRMAQRLGRCAQRSGVHHFVFSGRDIRSEACVMTLHPAIQSGM
jgi:hypothetical protein